MIVKFVAELMNKELIVAFCCWKQSNEVSVANY
jgi:hypothetical protein